MSVKLYRHNESGEVVAAILNRKSREFRVFHSNGYLGTDGEEWFLKKYTLLPESPEVGSDEWAFAMMSKGYEVCLPCWPNNKRISSDIGEYYTEITMPIGFDDWQLYEEPKPIVECLPHEFAEGQEVLVRDGIKTEWNVYIYSEYVHGTSHPFKIKTYMGGWRYCLPYEGNEHLEGTVTAGEHGAVPKGYVPPHVPQLGDETYWQVGDELINLADGFCVKIYKVSDIIEWESLEYAEREGVIFYKNGCHEEKYLRVWYHKGSYVREDGTVHEHIPTRPHKIEE